MPGIPLAMGGFRSDLLKWLLGWLKPSRLDDGLDELDEERWNIGLIQVFQRQLLQPRAMSQICREARRIANENRGNDPSQPKAFACSNDIIVSQQTTINRYSERGR